jgi:hypothetical protein
MYFKILALLMTALLAISCGDLGANKVVKQNIQSTRFNVGCTIKIERFSKILEEDIQDEISCLGKSLDLFVKVVRSGRPGYLSRSALEEYVQSNETDFKPEDLNAIKAVFEINHLIFGDDRNFISGNNVQKFIKFLLLFNREVREPYELFSSTSQVQIGLHDLQRNRVFKKADIIGKALLEILNPDRGNEVHEIDIISVLEAFSNNNNSGIEKIKSLIFLKKVILGGVKSKINHREMQDLLYKLSKLSYIAFDLARFTHIDLQQSSQLELLSGSIDNFELLMYYPENAEEILVTIPDLIKMGKFYLTDLEDFLEFPDMVSEIKQMVMGGDKDYVTPRDVYKAVSRAKDILTRGAIYHRIYDQFKVYLDSPRAVSINFDSYATEFPMHKKYVEEFARIVTKYRFFLGTFESPYYSLSYRRNANAVFEIGLMEYVFTIIFQRYGVATEGVGGYGVDVKMVEGIIRKFIGFLSKQEIVYAGREEKAAESATLMASLFQYQSNGDSFVNVNEAAEFGVSIFTALKVGDYFQDEMLAKCSGADVDDRNRVSQACFDNNFYGVLCKKFKNFYPRMFESLGISDCDSITMTTDNYNFLQVTEKVARVCTNFNDGSSVPMTKNDMLGIFGALLNIEATLTRFDENNNNQMDPYEVDEAYKIYGSAIRSMVKKEMAMLEPLSKQIFKYLVKYKKVPDSKDFKNILQFVKFLLKFNKKAVANRETIASILKVISEKGAPDPFNCDTLR